MLNKKVIFLIILFLSTVNCHLDPLGVNRTDFSATESFDYEILTKNKKRFRLNAINGSIDIEGSTDVTTVKIWGERIVRSESCEDAEEHLNNLKVSVVERQDEVFVETIQPESTHGRDYEVIYHVLLPKSWKVIVGNINGNVEVRTIEGDISIELINGTARLSDIVSNVVIGVTNGNIDSKSALPEHGTCRMSTVNGQISLTIPRETSANFNAYITNGDISISDLVLNNLYMTRRNTSGVLADGNGTISLEVINGQIKVKGF